MKTDFALRIISLEELDPALRKKLQAEVLPGEQVHHIIFTPSQRLSGYMPSASTRVRIPFRRGLTPEWVLVSTSQRLLIAASQKPGTSPEIISIQFQKSSRWNGEIFYFFLG